MNKGFEKLETAIATVDQRLRNLETAEAGCRGVQELRMAACDKEVAEVKKDLGELEAKLVLIEKELPIVRAVKWVAIALAVQLSR